MEERRRWCFRTRLFWCRTREIRGKTQAISAFLPKRLPRGTAASAYKIARFCLVPYIRVEDLLLDDDPPQIHIIHAKRGADRYVLILPPLADELRTHLRGRQTLWVERLASKDSCAHPPCCDGPDGWPPCPSLRWRGHPRFLKFSVGRQ